MKKISSETGIVTHKCNDLRTPLHDAAERGFLEIAIELLDNGGDINDENWNRVTPLHLACYYGRFQMVKLLLERGANIDAQDGDGRTPLHYACMNNHGEIARFLVTNNCDHTLKDNDGKKAHQLAKKPLNEDLIDFIIDYLMVKVRGFVETESNMGICVFCQRVQATYVFSPCDHVALCGSCYMDAKSRLKFCPMCRKTLTKAKKIDS